MNKIYATVGLLFAASAAIYYTVITKSDLHERASSSEVEPAESSPGEYGENILREDGWAIVPKEENGERVYWFVAPNVDGASPGVFKKTIHDGADGREFTIVSECEAPKAVCDRLTAQFEQLSKRYD